MRGLNAPATDLKGILSDKIPKEQQKVKEFRQKHGEKKVGEVSVNMVSRENHNNIIN